MNNNIELNHKLEEYNRKYRNRTYRLLKITKKEVEDFDKKNPTKTKNYLLKDRKWWFIGDTYYEIPKAPRYTWFRNLNGAVQAATCVLLGGAVVTAVVVPTVIAINKGKVNVNEVESDDGGTGVSIASTKVLENGAFEITLKVEEGKELVGVDKVIIGNQTLSANTDYVLVGNVITINKDVMEKHKNEKIIVTCKAQQKAVGTIEIVSKPTKWIYVVGETFDRTGLKVNLVKEDGTKEDVTDKCTTSMDGHEFVEGDKNDTKEVKVTYSGREVSFNIAVNDIYDTYLEVVDTNRVKKKKDATLPKNLLIPEKLNGYDIKYVNAYGFEYDDKVETIDFSNAKVQELFTEAFSGCTNLKKIIIGNTINAVGDSSGSAFKNCSKLEEIIFHNTNKINFYAHNGSKNFDGCSSLKTISIDSEEFANVIQNDENDYFDVTLYRNATYIYLKKGINLSNTSFIYNNYTKELVSDRDEYDKYKATEFTYDLNEESKTCSIKQGHILPEGDIVNIPEKYGDYTITSVSESGFENCTNNKTLVLSKNITNIGTNAFASSAFKKIILNNGLTQIGDSNGGVFNSSSIEEINIPSTITKFIREESGVAQNFYNCSNLTTVVIDSEEVANFKEEETDTSLFENAGIIYVKDSVGGLDPSSYILQNYSKEETSNREGYIKYVAPQYKFTITGDTTCTIEKNKGFTGGDVILPLDDGAGHNVTSIASYGFYGCENITNLTLSEHITTLEEGALGNCTSLATIDLKNVTTLNGYVFYGNTSLTEIKIPTTLTTIKMSFWGVEPNFGDCDNLTTVVIDSKTFADFDENNADTSLYSNATTLYLTTEISQSLSTASYIYSNYQIDSSKPTRAGYVAYSKK